MGLGVHFALKEPDVARLLVHRDSDELVAYITHDLTKEFAVTNARCLFRCEEMWEAIHRCLTDGELDYGKGPFPFSYAVLGGQMLDAGDDYTACLVRPDQVKDTAEALHDITRPWFERRFEELEHTDYDGPLSSDALEHTWQRFLALRQWMSEIAGTGRFVLFTCDC